MNAYPDRPHRMRTAGQAFTLVEVMIATAIFFIAMFAILGVLGSGIHAAALLRNNAPTAGMAIADLVITNQLQEGSETGDFGPIYRDFTWQRDIREYMTNGLFMVDVTVKKEGRVDSTLSVLFYKPDSPRH